MHKTSPFQIAAADADEDVADVAEMFREYAATLEVNLAYQDFDAELAGLPGAYAPPSGALLIARYDRANALGCVGLRRLQTDGVCEMKRLYVRPAGRGLGLGRALMLAVIEEAKRRGYREMRLDTLDTMGTAQKLYGEAGFTPIAPYYDGPYRTPCS